MDLHKLIGPLLVLAAGLIPVILIVIEARELLDGIACVLDGAK